MRAAPGKRAMLTKRALLASLGVACVLIVWEVTVRLYGLPRIVLPEPWPVVTTLVGLLRTAEFWRDVGVSVYEFLAGYGLGVVLGIAVGMLTAESRLFRMTFAPVVESFRFIVAFAWIPLTVLWFGTSFTGKIVLVAYAVFFVMAISTARAFAGIDPTLSRVGIMLGMNRWAMAWKIHLRAAAGTVASAAKAAAAVGWIAVVAAEYIGASAGLGVMITNAATSLETDVVIAGMIAIGLIGAGVSALVAWFARNLSSAG